MKMTMKCCARPSILAVALILSMALGRSNSETARHNSSKAPVLHNQSKASVLHNQSKAPIPFDKFIKSVAQARYSNYRSLPGAKVESEAEFEKMKKHILHFYDYYGRKAYSTFMSDGRCFDCLIYSFPVASPTSGLPSPSPSPEPIPSALRDPRCPKGGFPIERLTLERLVQWQKLDYVQSKDGEGGGDAEPLQTQQQKSAPHRSGTKGGK